MITGHIQSIAFGGDGILKSDGLVIFVPFTAPDDQVTIEMVSKKKNFARGHLRILHAPGPDRIPPVCPYFTTCGGCQLQHINYPAQLEIKRRFIEDALHRIAKIPMHVPAIIPAPHQYAYRCHVTLRMKPHSTGFQAGYTSWDHLHFIPITQCPIFCASEDSIVRDVQQLLASLDNQGIQDAHLRLFKSQDNYLLALQCIPHPPSNVESVCKQWLHTHPSIQAIVINTPSEKIIYGTPICETESLGISAIFSPFGFLQNFPEQRDVIYNSILADAPKGKKVLDLYCGIGITSLLFAQQGNTVIGIELNPESIAIAEQNALRNHIHTTTFYAKRVEEVSASFLKTFQPDSVLCNPPREGLDPSVIEALIACRVPDIQYLSCMPSTLARDLKLFTAHGYTIKKIQGFDMFPQTTHVETLVLLNRLD